MGLCLHASVDDRRIAQYAVTQQCHNQKPASCTDSAPVCLIVHVFQLVKTKMSVAAALTPKLSDPEVAMASLLGSIGKFKDWMAAHFPSDQKILG